MPFLTDVCQLNLDRNSFLSLNGEHSYFWLMNQFKKLSLRAFTLL